MNTQPTREATGRATFTLTVIETDLDAAIARFQQSNYKVCDDCVVAQAMSRLGEKPWAAYSVFSKGERYTLHGSPFVALVQAFDEGEYDAARAMLPLTATLNLYGQ